MQFLSVLAAGLLAVSSVSAEKEVKFGQVDLWASWKAKFNKVYETEKEELHRQGIFFKNMALVDLYNEMDDATYGHTQFMDLTEDEFKSQFLGYAENKAALENQLEDIDTTDVPTEVDWTAKGYVTPVKNQGQCGSCWAFSTTGNIEGQHFKKTGKLVSLSEQQLVDCDKKADQGCQGGLPSNAFQYIEGTGLESESDYPYRGTDGTCNYSKDKVAATISSWKKISTNETQIQAQVAAIGPLSIGINAGPMQFYFGGVSCPWKILCNPKSLDHGVLITGYGTDGGKDYWKIKNSWGASWGEKGYYRICRNKGACGLNNMVTTAEI